MTTPDNANPQAGAGRPLPKKEADIFNNVVKHYEMKQYKKAIKHADTILKKFPNHGETLAMKGLTYNYMKRKEEAHALVKEGLRNDMRSHVCWHVYGLLHRSDRNYNEAIKAYKQALRIDPQNLQILRDLSMLQIQMRDLEGFLTTRNTLLTLKPYAKINWMAFSLAKHLTGDLEGAVNVIDIYLGTLPEGSSELGRCFESSELAMYRNMILSEIPNNFQVALEHLDTCESIVVDRGAWLLKRAEYQLKLKDYDSAVDTVLSIFQRGMTEDYRVHSLYMCALLRLDNDSMVDEALSLTGTQTLATMVPLTMEQKAKISERYRSTLQPKFPKSQAIHRIPLTIMEGDELYQALEEICRRDLAKGVPSLCSDLRSFMWVEKSNRFVRPLDPIDIRRHPVYKMAVDMVDGFISSLRSSSKFSSSDADEEPPSTLLWAWYLRAGLHELSGEYQEGLAVVEKCLEHTPTLVDVYELKARLLKASGDIKSAVECLDKGRDLDRQDRYINNQTARYMLLAGMEEDALKRISMFTRHEGNPEQNLFDMQCSWYERELASNLARKKEWGRSLKKYSAIVKHFDDINEDQFDFHTYCLRKVTLRAYVSTLRFEDQVYGHEYFRQAASGMIRIYLNLLDNPIREETDEPDYSKMSAAERKKAKAIARKKKKVSEKKETESTEKEDNGRKAKAGKSSFIDVDPEGKELLKKDPLEEAKNLSAILSRSAPQHIDTWILQYDVSIRREKALMALQSLMKANSLDPENPQLFSRTVDFAQKIETFTNSEVAIKTIIQEGITLLLGGNSLEEFVRETLNGVRQNKETSLSFRVAVARTLVELNVGTKGEAIKIIQDSGLDCRCVTLESCIDALNCLNSFGSEAASAVTEFAGVIIQRFPLATDLQ